jgi:radical SAM superfamily enzyme YgiQ (UPF0313 family)
LNSILFLQPWLGRSEKVIFPIGLHALYCYVAWKRPGLELSILDQNAAPDPEAALAAALERRPELICLSLRNVDTTNRRDLHYHYAWLPPLLRAITRLSPQSVVVIGGAGFSMHATAIMERNPELRYGVFLEGEETLCRLLDRPTDPAAVPGLYYRDESGAVRFSGPRPPLDLAAIPARTRAPLDLGPYHDYGAFGIEYKRGCALKCDYCSYPFLGGRTVRSRPVEVVVREMAWFHREHGVSLFHLTDPIFNVPRESAVAFCRTLVAARLPMKWIGWFNERYLDQELVDLALEAGCAEFVFSPDGYGRRSLAELQKNIRPEDIRHSYRLARKNRGMRVSWNFVANPPGERAVDVFSLFLFYVRAKLTLGRRLVAFFINHIRLEPDTGLYRRAVEEGVVSAEQDLLPERVEDLRPLFYCNPATRWGMVVLDLLERLKGLLRTLLGRG